MQAQDFDFGRFREFRAAREERVRDFLKGKTGGVFLQERAHSNYVICRTPQESLAVQLEGITRNLDLDSGYLPYLEPWFGVGVFANAFGCEYVWSDGESPQTHYRVHNLEAAGRLARPEITAAPVMKLVLRAIEYFLEQTRGEIPIACTDTQSPLDNATLIWETSSFFTAMYEAPDLVHRFLDMITDVMLEFTREQVRRIGGALTCPGHIMLSATGGRGLSISDDNIVMLSPEMYAEFARPYNERLASEFGGLAVHSCGNYERQLPALLATKGLFLIDGAFSPEGDPNPNLDFEMWRDAIKGTDIILQPRLHLDWPQTLSRLYDPDLPLAPVVPAPAPDEPREKNKQLLEAILAGA